MFVFSLSNLCLLLYNYLAIDSPWSWIFGFEFISMNLLLAFWSSEAQLNITNLRCPALDDPVQTKLVLRTVAQIAVIVALLLFLFLL